MERLKRIQHPTNPVSRLEDKPKEIPKPVDKKQIKLRQRYAESSFDDNKVSEAGALGRYQIMPSTGEEYVALTGDVGDLTDPVYNERVRDYYMDKRLPQFKVIKEGYPVDSVLYAKKLAAYNWGPGNLRKHIATLKRNGVDVDNSMDWINTLPEEPRNYVNFILRGQDVNQHLNNKEYQKTLKKNGKNK